VAAASVEIPVLLAISSADFSDTISFPCSVVASKLYKVFKKSPVN